jgi:hypothetical protein
MSPEFSSLLLPFLLANLKKMLGACLTPCRSRTKAWHRVGWAAQLWCTLAPLNTSLSLPTRTAGRASLAAAARLGPG